MVAKQFAKHCIGVMNRIICLGFCIQMVLGSLWMCNAFAGMHDFGKGIVCVGAIVLFGVAVYLAFPNCTTKKRVFTTVSVLTFPMVLQCLVRPDGRLVAAALLLFGYDVLLIKKLARKRWLIAGALVTVCLIAGIVELAKIDPLIRVADRITWTTLYHDYGRLEDEDQVGVDYAEVMESLHEAVGIETVLVPSLNETVGPDKTVDILQKMIVISLRIHKSRIAKEIIWDEAGYLFAPIVLPLQLAGRAYESYAGVNYRNLLEPAPGLGSLYLYYSCALFTVSMILRMLGWLLQERRMNKGICCYVVAVMGVMSLGYTLSSAGRMDYKNVLFIYSMWLIWILNQLCIDNHVECLSKAGELHQEEAVDENN